MPRRTSLPRLDGDTDKHEEIMVYIENEGALYRSTGFMTECPDELYSRKQGKWIPYTGETPKQQGWGERISEQEADEWILRLDETASHALS